jgi:hypothetical protein
VFLEDARVGGLFALFVGIGLMLQNCGESRGLFVYSVVGGVRIVVCQAKFRHKLC